MVEPDLNQESVGTGTASALQVNVAVSPTLTIVCTGGSVKPGISGPLVLQGIVTVNNSLR